MHQKSLSNQALITLNQPRHAKHGRHMQPSLYVRATKSPAAKAAHTRLNSKLKGNKRN
jgi:hypothetical protein